VRRHLGAVQKVDPGDPRKRAAVAGAVVAAEKLRAAPA
jgi:hypothetical protein